MSILMQRTNVFCVLETESQFVIVHHRIWVCIERGPNKLKVYEGESCNKHGSTKEVETTLFMRICKNIQRPSNKLNVFHNPHLFQ